MGKKSEAAVEGGFIDAGKGYALGLKEGRIVCRGPKGQLLASVPKDLKESDAAERLHALRDFLAAHERECAATVEGWMLRSLPTPADVLEAVWADASYRRVLENLVVVRSDDEGRGAFEEAGFLRGVDPKKGLGLVGLDGETTWETAAALVPHPILLGELEDFRSLSVESGLTQHAQQLFREVFAKPRDLAGDAHAITAYRGGKFEQLTHARGAARALGYRVAGGCAICRVHEAGKTYEARFWIGADDGMSETHTEDLVWVDAAGTAIAVRDVPPIAFSEGMRMASAIFAKRVIEKEGDDA